MSEFESQLAALTATMEELIALLGEENAALAQNRPGFVADQVNRRISLGRTFERQMQQLAPSRELLAALPTERKAAIAALSDRFRAVSSANEAAIGGAKRATERVVGHLLEALRKQSAVSPSGYGRPNQATRRAPSSRVSVSVDQSL